MQINPFSPIIKEAFKYLGWFLLFLFLWFNGCSHNEKSSTTTTVTVPETKGKFEAKKPTHTPITNSVVNKSLTTENGSFSRSQEVDKRVLAENEKLKQDFAKASDSIKKLQFDKAIQLNKFSSQFENDDVKININGIVQGEVKEITPSYIIKEKKIEIPVKVKETVFRLLVGGEIGNNTKLDGFAAKANLMLQNRKGNILTASFDTNQTIWVGYNFSLFDVKR